MLYCLCVTDPISNSSRLTALSYLLFFHSLPNGFSRNFPVLMLIQTARGWAYHTFPPLALLLFFAVFCRDRQVISLLFNRLCTLCKKHRGVPKRFPFWNRRTLSAAVRRFPASFPPHFIPSPCRATMVCPNSKKETTR